MVQLRLWKDSNRSYDELVKHGMNEGTTHMTVGSAKGPYLLRSTLLPEKETTGSRYPT